MGFGIKELLIILVIVALIFGTKKLKSIGSDLGGAVKGFKKSIADDEEAASLEDKSQDSVIEADSKTAAKEEK